MLGYNRIRDNKKRLGPKVEAKDAAVGEEEVVERQEEGLPSDGRQRPNRLRQLRPLPRAGATARGLGEQRGGQLPRRAELAQPRREGSNPCGALRGELAGGNAGGELRAAPPLLLEDRVRPAAAVTTSQSRVSRFRKS